MRPGFHGGWGGGHTDRCLLAEEMFLPVLGRSAVVNDTRKRECVSVELMGLFACEGIEGECERWPVLPRLLLCTSAIGTDREGFEPSFLQHRSSYFREPQCPSRLDERHACHLATPHRPQN